MEKYHVVYFCLFNLKFIIQSGIRLKSNYNFFVKDCDFFGGFICL